MSLFKRNNNQIVAPVAIPATNNYSALAELTLNSITDGVLLVDERGVIKFANPAVAKMTGYNSPENIINLNYGSILRLENSDGSPIVDENSPLAQAFIVNNPFMTRDYMLATAQGDRRLAVMLNLIPTGTVHDDRIITLRDITKELKDEQEKSEFISTASHEMRTPVASIEGYLALALNPQTATIDERAHQYLEAAHKASKHLGDLFRDLLDVTKMDDNQIKLHLAPVDIVATVKEFSDAREKDMQKKHLKYSFGTSAPITNEKQVEQIVYASVDLQFLQEIMDNLIDNAIKYTPEGGEIWVNARGDGDKVVINVTDTGIGVSPDDATHIFQKFYRVDNSQTRQIGGTGLGLYLVKQRVEAMNGRVWVESAFGDGSTFFVSLPRLTDAEYQKQKIAYDNEQLAQAQAEQKSMMNSGGVVPVAQPVSAPETPVMQNSAPVQPAGTPGMSGVPNVPAPSAQNVPSASVVPTVQMQAQISTPVSPAVVPAETAPAAPPVPIVPEVPNTQNAPVAPAAQSVSIAPSVPVANQPLATPNDSIVNQKESI